MPQIGFGTFCTNYNSTISTNRTFRLKNLSLPKLMETFIKNLQDFIKMLDLCKSMGIEVFRLGSRFIPYVSHKNFKEDWLCEIEPYLLDLGDKIKNDYKIRITMHPGQFVVLNSPHKKVVEQSLKELRYHFWILDKLNIGDEGIVIVHVGGVYEDKKKAVERFIDTVEKNSWLKRRLAVENDEKSFSAKDTLEIAKILNIPFVFDYFHHLLNLSDFNMNDLIKTWERHGVPKFHISSDSGLKSGLHGDFVKLEDFINFHNMFKKVKIKKIHLMVEAKKKEKAIQKLMEQIKDLV